jgi:hypothetical protein
VAEGGEVRLRDGVLRVTAEAVVFEHSVFLIPVRHRYPLDSVGAVEVRREVPWWIFALSLLLLGVQVVHALVVGVSERFGLLLPVTSSVVALTLVMFGVQMSKPALVLHARGKKVRLRASREQAAAATGLIQAVQGASYATSTSGAADGPTTRSFRSG